MCFQGFNIKILQVIMIIISALYIAGCGKNPLISILQGNQEPAVNTVVVPPPPLASNSVSITGFTFSQQALTVTAGTTVTWTNNDSVAHTVTSNTSIFDSGTINPGGTYSRAFAAVGVFPYKCTFHPSMTGTITVQ